MTEYKRDVQKNKLYKVERIWGSNHNSPKNVSFKDLKEASNHATWIWINFKKKIYGRYSYGYKKNTPTVKCFKIRGGTSLAHNGFYPTNTNRFKYYKKISLSRYHYSFDVIIHEMAHHLAPRREMHGPIFTKIYMYLLAYYLDYDLEYMCKIANEHNLQFASDDLYLNTMFNKLFLKQQQKRKEVA